MTEDNGAMKDNSKVTLKRRLKKRLAEHEKLALKGLESAAQQAKIREARRRKPEPTWDDVIQLLTQVRDEMDQCKQPYRRY